MESTTSDIVVYSKPSTDNVNTSVVSKQIIKRSVADESDDVVVPVVVVVAAADAERAADPAAVAPANNCTYIDHVVDKKITDIDNNNEQLIVPGNQAGLYS